MSLHASYKAVEPRIVRGILKVIMWVALVLASPFLAYAAVSALLGRSVWWIAIPAGIGALILLAGFVAWAWAWWWLRRVAAALRVVDYALDA